MPEFDNFTPQVGGGGGDLRFDRMVSSPQFQECKKNSSSSWMNFFTSTYGVAIIIGMCTFILLIIAQPPFVMTKPESVMEDPRINWWLVMVYTLIVMALVLLVPPVHRYCGKAFKSQESIMTPKINE
jgi:Mg2+/Co2+ transporter CorB